MDQKYHLGIGGNMLIWVLSGTGRMMSYWGLYSFSSLSGFELHQACVNICILTITTFL